MRSPLISEKEMSFSSNNRKRLKLAVLGRACNVHDLGLWTLLVED
jgi:hypothetical protein